MPDELPKGWIRLTMGDVGRWFGGGTPSKANPRFWTGGNIPWVSPKDMKSDVITDAQDHITENAVVESATNLVDAGSVLIVVRSGILQHTLPVAVAQRQVALNQDLKAVKPRENIRSDYLAFALKAFESEILDTCTKAGTTVQSLDIPVFLRFPIPVAPLPEQARIVARLDAVLSRVAVGEAAARRALERLQRYRAAVLHAAVTGELTRDWRKANQPNETGAQVLKSLLQERRARWEEAELKRLHAVGKPPKDNKWKKRYPEPATPDTAEFSRIPRNWAWASADQLTDATRSITYGVIKLGATVAGGVPVLRSSDVRELKLDPNVVKRVARKITDGYRRTYLRGGEVLVTVRGTLGGVVAVPPSCAGYNISREVALLALLEPTTSRSNAIFIASDLLQQWLNKRAKGVAYTGINIETLRQLPLPVPPLKEQAQIALEVEGRLTQADRLVATMERQFVRARAMRQSLMREAFLGQLVPQDLLDEPASALLERTRAAWIVEDEAYEQAKKARTKLSAKRKKETRDMHLTAPTTEDLNKAWQKIGKRPDAKELFEAAGYSLDQVPSFYESLRTASDIVNAFKTASNGGKGAKKASVAKQKQAKQKPGRFRLVSLWLEDFKNLKDYEVRFDAAHGLDIVLGWNGTGKSNLFEALVLIFRDLHYWWEKNKWPDNPLAGYCLRYEIENQLVEVKWIPFQMKRPEVAKAKVPESDATEVKFGPAKRENLPLPKFVFGYYSGPTNRMADHFWPMKRDHYDRLRKASSDDPKTLAMLLEQRRFFCAEASHAKYVLLAFSYKEDAKIWKFLEDRLRIVGFESALFIIRKPPWARGKPQDFWGATGIMRRVMEKLRRYAVAPMVLKQKVADGYRQPTEELYYFFLPNLNSLHEFAAEYSDARSFFLALESTDFSDLIYDVKIQVRIKAAENQETAVTFRELSEGEQQLLMVLGLMRFTKSHQSLVLLDEPDTHLNPHWSVEYLKDLVSVTSDDDDPSPEQQTSQTLLATHDPLVIASLLKDQVHLLKRNRDSLQCYWQQASENPRGLGYTGILLSDMFGFNSDLDEETLALLTRQVQLAGKAIGLSPAEKSELELLNKQIETLGFKTVSSDPYYRAFIEALTRRQETLALMQKPEQTPDERAKINKAADEILAELAQKHSIKP